MSEPRAWTIYACPECGAQCNSRTADSLEHAPAYCLNHEAEDRSERPAYEPIRVRAVVFHYPRAAA